MGHWPKSALNTCVHIYVCSYVCVHVYVFVYVCVNICVFEYMCSYRWKRAHLVHVIILLRGQPILPNRNISSRVKLPRIFADLRRTLGEVLLCPDACCALACFVQRYNARGSWKCVKGRSIPGAEALSLLERVRMLVCMPLYVFACFVPADA